MGKCYVNTIVEICFKECDISFLMLVYVLLEECMYVSEFCWYINSCASEMEETGFMSELF